MRYTEDITATDKYKKNYVDGFMKIIDKENIGAVEFKINPVYIKDLDFAECRYKTHKGEIYVKWERVSDSIELLVELDGNIKATYCNEQLKNGRNKFKVR